MTSTLDPFLEATRLLVDVWGDARAGAGLSRAQLVAVNDALGVVKRTADAVHAEVVAGIAHESRRELGPESLSKQHRLVPAPPGTSSPPRLGGRARTEHIA